MRLINVKTLQLEEHINPPRYAILSHTWRDGEVLFSEYNTGKEKGKAGYSKISYLCTQAELDNINYVWIDTVCIDKSSSTELSEAINSMFSWYKNAVVCYVYLDDVDSVTDIAQSRWITRAWTLQELIAPLKVHFFAKNWNFLGTKQSLIASLVEYTGIEQFVLENPGWMLSISVAGRMSWAANRRATRVEDIAYCLFGIFDVNLPLLYGEGSKSFQRLQHEILRQSQDLSILAFEREWLPGNEARLFAQDPSSFRNPVKIVNEAKGYDCELTSKGLRVSVEILQAYHKTHQYWINLGCRFEFDRDGVIALSGWPDETWGDQSPLIMKTGPITVLSRHKWRNVSRQTILLTGQPPLSRLSSYNDRFRYVCALQAQPLVSHGFRLINAKLEDGLGSWNEDAMISEVVTTSPVVIRKFGFVHEKHSEAFIITVVDARKEHTSIKTSSVFLSVKSKPKGLDCEIWLTEQGMYSTIKPLSNQEGEEFLHQVINLNAMIDGWEWKVIKWSKSEQRWIVPTNYKTKLLSRCCFGHITVVVEISSSKPGYALKLSTGPHADLK